MSRLSGKLASFIDESSLEFIPWGPDSQKQNSSDFSANRVNSEFSIDRSFHYLKSLHGLPTYAEDFGFQWTELYDDYRKDRYKHLDQFLRLGLNPELLRDKNCLDVGCGLGRLSEICLGRANYVFGVDLSAAVLEAARLIRSEKFVPIQASADCMPLKNNCFDFIYCWGVLHHTENPEKTLGEMWRVLKPGGALAIWVYPRNSWYLKRSLLAKYFSTLDEHAMLSFSDLLTSLSHTSQLTSQAFLKMLTSDLSFSIKNTKEYTRHILYDGLGPTYHYLLDSKWFYRESKSFRDLAYVKAVDKPFTVAHLKKLS